MAHSRSFLSLYTRYIYSVVLLSGVGRGGRTFTPFCNTFGISIRHLAGVSFGLASFEVYRTRSLLSLYGTLWFTHSLAHSSTWSSSHFLGTGLLAFTPVVICLVPVARSESRGTLRSIFLSLQHHLRPSCRYRIPQTFLQPRLLIWSTLQSSQSRLCGPRLRFQLQPPSLLGWLWTQWLDQSLQCPLNHCLHLLSHPLIFTLACFHSLSYVYHSVVSAAVLHF